MSPTVGAAIASIPPRNGFLQDAVRSAIQQQRPVDQISVVVDSAREGVAVARNRAWRALGTDYVAFLDDDDVWQANHVRLLMQRAVETDADVVYPWFSIDTRRRPGWQGVSQGNEFLFVEVHDAKDGVTLLPAGGRPFDKLARESLRYYRNHVPVTALVRRSVLDLVGGFPEPGTPEWPHEANEDWGLWQKVIGVGGTFEHVDARTWVWRWHTNHTMGRPGQW